MAALLLEFISGIQYYYTRRLLESELGSHVESELTLKAVLIKSTLNASEYVVQDHLRDVYRNLSTPDSLFGVARRLLTAHPQFTGAAVAFRPNYYPNCGLLFEPWASRSGDSIRIDQIAGIVVTSGTSGAGCRCCNGGSRYKVCTKSFLKHRSKLL